MAIRPYIPAQSSNVALLHKADPSTIYPRGLARDALRPTKGRRRGASGDDNWGFSLSSLQSERDRIQRLLDTYRYDIDIFAMVRQVMRRIPPWTLLETETDGGDEQHKAVLDAFFHLPDGENTAQQIIRCTVARMKMLGKAHWVLRRLNEDTLKEQGTTMLALQHNLVNVLSKQLDLDAAQTLAAVRDLMGDNAPIGFELLDGAVRYNKKERVWEQSVGAHGATKTFPTEDVIEYRVMDPSGGTMSELARLEAWSDASVRVFKLNADSVKTGGMADMLILLYGTNQREVERLEALMEDRADPARTDDVWLPMIAHATAPEGSRVGVQEVELSRRDRESRGLEFDKSLRVRKAGATGVPLQSVGEWQQVNRANMEVADYVLMEHEVLPWCEDFAEQVNEQVIMDVFGFNDYEFGFEEVDTRGEEFAHRQDLEYLQNGTITPYDYWVKANGQERADAMLKQVVDIGVDEQAMKIPWQYSGNKWAPMSENIPAPFWTDPAKAPQGKQPVPLAVPGQQQVGQEGDAGGEQPTGAAGDRQQLATPEVMSMSLDNWQRRCNDALRKIGVAYDPEGAAGAWAVLPNQMYISLEKDLYNCTSVAEVSNVFKDARAVLNTAHEKLEKVVQTPQHVLRALSSAIDEVFIAREGEAQQRLQERLAVDPGAFETEIVDEDEEDEE